MLSFTTIAYTAAYTTTFLATSASLNFITDTIKNSLPEIDMKTIEATSPDLANFASYASIASSWAIFGLKIYVAHQTGMGAITTVSTAIDAASGAYALINGVNAMIPTIPTIYAVAGYMPDMAALVSIATGVVTHNLESVSTYDVANVVLKGVLGCSLEDLGSVVNLANSFSVKDFIPEVSISSVVDVVDIISTGMIGVSASNLIHSVSDAALFFNSGFDYDLL